MTFLPIVTRELRVAARRRSTFFFRMTAAVLGLLVLLWIMLISGLSSAQQHLGKDLFHGLSTLAFCYAMLMGLFTTADCVSEEKREGTLGLLFLTDLKGYDVVLGKLVATSVNAVYGLLALFPVVAIPLLAGGVTVGEFWRVILVMLNSIFISLALGMFISASTRDERVAMSLTFFLLIFINGGLPFIGGLATDWSGGRGMHPLFYMFSPAFTCMSAFDSPFAPPPSPATRLFYWSLLCVNVTGWLCLLLACYFIPRSWQDKGSGLKAGAAGERWQQWRFGSTQSRLLVRRRLLALNPFQWLAGRDQMKSVLVWIFLAIMALFWFWGLAVYKEFWRHETIYVLTMLTVNTVLKLWMANESCRQLGQDRRSGALELLLSTPLSVPKILSGQLMALWQQFAGPVAVVLAVEFLFLMGGLDTPGWALACVAGMSVLVADLVTLSWLGMWLGLNSRSLHRASAASVVRVLVLPWLVFGLLLTGMAVSDSVFGVQFLTRAVDDWGENFPIAAWFALSVLIDLIFCAWARQHLLQDFREIATSRFDRRGRVARPEQVSLTTDEH